MKNNYYYLSPNGEDHACYFKTGLVNAQMGTGTKLIDFIDRIKSWSWSSIKWWWAGRIAQDVLQRKKVIYIDKNHHGTVSEKKMRLKSRHYQKYSLWLWN